MAHKHPGKRSPVPFTAEELRSISEEISERGFPGGGTTRLELMEIDPWNIYAYWHINAPDMARCRARLPENARNVRLVLRFTDLSPRLHSAQTHEKFDIEVREDSNNWYVNLWRDAKHYSSEIGLRSDDGGFEALARSNEVATPRAGPSPDLDFAWTEVPTRGLPEPAQSITPIALNIDLLRDLFPQRQPLPEEFPLVAEEVLPLSLDEPVFPAGHEAGDASITEGLEGGNDLQTADDIVPDGVIRASGQAEALDGFPMVMKQEISHYGQLARNSKKIMMAGKKLPPLSPLAEDMIAPTGIELVSNPLPILESGEHADGMSRSPAAWTPEATGTAVEYPAVAGESAGPGNPMGGTQENPAPMPVALEMLAGRTTSSPVAGERGFDVAASLVVEGHCPPNSRLLLFGEPVHTEPDGTFRLQLPLECGPELVELLYRVRSRRQGEE